MSPLYYVREAKNGAKYVRSFNFKYSRIFFGIQSYGWESCTWNTFFRGTCNNTLNPSYETGTLTGCIKTSRTGAYEKFHVNRQSKNPIWFSRDPCRLVAHNLDLSGHYVRENNQWEAKNNNIRFTMGKIRAFRDSVMTIVL